MSRATAVPPARLVILLVALFAAAALLLSAGTPAASAAKPCWERVVDDWIDNGSIDAAYSPACLQAALRNVPEDIRAYSDFEERVKQARQDALRNRFLQGSGGSGETQGTSPGRERRLDRVEEVEPDVREPDGGPLQDALSYGATDATSIPVPLMILAGLALVLMTAGGAGFAHRKLQARKARSR
jgi:hypothetical protein